MNVSDAWGGEYMPVRFDWIVGGVARLAVSAIVATLIGVPTDDTCAGTELVIEDLEPSALETIRFSVNRQAGVTVEAVGAGLKAGEYWFAYPWILDARTRQLVWSMAEEITDPVGGSKWLREYDDKITLRPGSYELIYYAGPPYYYFGFGSGDLKELLDGLGGWFEKGKADFPDDEDIRDDLAPRYLVRLTSEAELRVEDSPGQRRAVITLVHPGNDSYRKVDFALTDDCDLEVYCVGEFAGSAESMVDGGWIVDVKTHARVWDMAERNTDHAGGAAKNRRFHENVRLKRGEYTAYYVTDDSHTWDDWNAPPPIDPEAWGLQIFPARDSDAGKIESRAARASETPLLRLTGIGDNELVSETFRLKESVPFRVYAIGEYDQYSDRMADYAWITRADDRTKIWAMSGANTDPAGGASKNRQFDGLVELSAGDYSVYFVSDGSHSEGSGWNSSPPYDQKAYGVSIYAGTPDFDRSAFMLIAKSDVRTPGLLAAITEVGDDAEESRRFTLASPTRVRIHALGEGSRSGLVDYGWIADARTGDVVWEMTYRKTSHAGGSDKNREVDQVILLDKGEYILHYESDDSHSFPDWNTTPPHDPMAWGITVSEVGKTQP
jgi:hypothetical protein